MTEKDLDLAKKSAALSLVKQNESGQQRAENDFISNVINAASTEDTIENILKMTLDDVKQAQYLFAKEFGNVKKLNVVVMFPKEALTKMQTLKSFVTHGFKLL